MRSRRSLLIVLLLILVPSSGAIVGLLVAVKREPAFYAAARCPADWNTRDRAARLMTRVQDLKNDIRSKPVWGDTFSAEDLNCFLQENMGRKDHGLCSLLPSGFHSPRLSIEGDRLRLGFRYGEGFWSTVGWLEMQVWLVSAETNVVAVELSDLSAGALPIGTQSILEGISEAARNSNIEVTWYRNKSHPVGLFKFYADQARPSAQILTLDVKEGHITIAGRSFMESTPGFPLSENSTGMGQ